MRLLAAWSPTALLLVFGVLGSVSSAQMRRPPGRTPGIPYPTLPPSPAPTQPAVPSYMKIRVEDGLVTAEIRATPLQQVLAELADRTGVIFEIQSQENQPVSISLFRVSLEESIQRILSGENSINYYDRDASGQSRVVYVRVFPRANQPPQPSLRYIGTGVVTKSGDDTPETPEQALKALTASQNLDVRQKAIEVLVAAGGEASITALMGALSDPAAEIRAAAIEGLASLGARNVLPAIILSLQDSHPGVRQSAIMAVALLGDAENVRDLKPLIKDRDASVAAAAEIAIRKLSSSVRRP